MADQRLSPQEAGLVVVGAGSRCGSCIYWSKDETCDLVRGKIRADMCCDGWQNKARVNDYKFSAGSVFLPALKTSKVAKGIYTRQCISLVMPKSAVRKEPEPKMEEEEKSEPVETLRHEEVKVQGDERPEHPLDEEPAMTKAPEGSVGDADEDEAEEYDNAVKAINARFEALETSQKSITSMLKELTDMVKSNYTSSPHKPGRESDYPAPNEDGPLSDGTQAPRLTQSTNPNSKPFGKDASSRRALAGAGDGAKETNIMKDGRMEDLESILKGQTKVLALNAARRGSK